MIRTYLRILSSLMKTKIGVQIPRKVEHICTYSCNLKCRFCDLWKRESSELSTQGVKRLMDEFYGLGTLSWYFGGGEPLLRKDIKELVLYAKKLGFYVTMNTNGLLVPENISWLKNVDLVGVSLDGPKGIHEKLRGMGTYDRTINAIKLLKKENVDFYIASLITKNILQNNLEGLRVLLDLSLSLDAKIAFLPLFDDKFNKGKIEPIRPSEAEFQEVIHILIEYKKKHPRNLLMSRPTLKSYMSPDKPFKCDAGGTFCTVFPDGKIAACRFMTKEDTFKEIQLPEECSCSLLCYREYTNLFRISGLRDLVMHLI